MRAKDKIAVASEQTSVIEQALTRLGANAARIMPTIAECENGLWYLDEKIVVCPEDASRNNARALKYAYNLKKAGADVTFLRESSTKTPDLKIEILGSKVYFEIRSTRFKRQAGTAHPASKIVSVVIEKRSQLPESEIGFVAIDNFDLNVESNPDEGFTHEHIVDGLVEVGRLARSNPGGWRSPSGVIVAAHTSGVASSRWPPAFPHFVWVNDSSRPTAPTALVRWIRQSLPDGQTFDAAAYSEANET